MKVGGMKKKTQRFPFQTLRRFFYFKLPYTGPFSVVTEKRVRHFAERYCDNIDMKLAF